MAWTLLLLAGVCEITWAIMAKYSHGFTKFWPSAGTILFTILSLLLLILAMKKLPLGTAYAVWTGIGAIGTVSWGIIFFNEPRDWMRLACIALIVTGIIGLKLHSPTGSL